MKVNQDHGKVLFIQPNSFTQDPGWPEGTPVTADVAKAAAVAGNTVCPMLRCLYGGHSVLDLPSGQAGGSA